jgi:hypothetical protein
LLLAKAKIQVPNISLKVAVFGATVVGFVYSFLIGGILGFRSWTLTPLIDFENERLLAYFMAFALGVLSYRKNIFAQLPKSKTLYNVANSVAWIPVTGHIFVRLWPFFIPEGFSITPLYRLLWHLTFYLSLVCMVYVMIETFWRYFDKTGPVWSWLNKNSYGVYIIHVVVIGIFGTLLLNTNLPVLVKYPTLVVSAYLGSNLLVWIYQSLAQSLKTGRRKAISQTADAV